MSQPKEITDLTGWKTPNTYDGDDLGDLPRGPGVYLLIRTSIVQDRSAKWGQRIVRHVLYVGMSNNVSRRITTHEIIKALARKRDFVEVWFKRCPAARLRIREKKLIQEFDPPYNIIHRVRGEN